MVNCVTIDKGDRLPVSPQQLLLGFTQPTGSDILHRTTIDKGDRVPVSPQQLLLGFTQPTVSDILHRTW
ncbi:MAG: hypothetical protein P5702_22620 [Limnospira sp. PMC 1291.21]|uniref:hypothetical protein n=1 Tax=Limnospira TaxID=2596745 RepID=UPI00031A2CEF|nr:MULTISPECIES: hypothetical protein [Limnospira]MDC0838016.1 hypothetical protein [Limnoraphis robusta]RAQ40279.1 hypothetical protein B9S53_16735 [Arthrospira sp. O9.13F]MDT9180451.1 hypothetical protein [Limnospira sp. PMC 1238.20]MDT9195772.1 hypothetical protein [Limnospira sp. PMC 1245.20]MDT9200860.1 hypothetical protein [Limnospira sp. PMC 1042.18]